MLLLSTLIACLHLGVRPADAVWADVFVRAPVAEPGVDEALRSAVLRSLVAHDAVGGSATLELLVVEASLSPSVRGDSAGPGGGLWYRARLSVVVEGRTITVEDWVAETGVVPDRERIFRALAERLARLI